MISTVVSSSGVENVVMLIVGVVGRGRGSEKP